MIQILQLCELQPQKLTEACDGRAANWVVSILNDC